MTGALGKGTVVFAGAALALAGVLVVLSPLFLLVGLAVGLVSWTRAEAPAVPPPLEAYYRQAQAETGVPWQAVAAWDAVQWGFDLPVDSVAVIFTRLYDDLWERRAEARRRSCEENRDPETGEVPDYCREPIRISESTVISLQKQALRLHQQALRTLIFTRAYTLQARVEQFAVNPEDAYRGLVAANKVTYTADLFEGYLLAADFEDGHQDHAPVGVAPVPPPGFVPSPGWIWPAAGPITSRYGSRISPIDGQPRFHAGMDIGVPTGAEVVASKAGRVTAARPDAVYGLVVTLDHGGGYRSLYAHNSRLEVWEGQQVSQGALLARAGSSGQSTGPHVHFEIHLRGVAYDPLLFLGNP